MKIELGEVALQYGQVVRDALASAGGDQLVQLAAAEPGQRELAARALGETGAWDLDPRSGSEELKAAAACRGTGWWAAPYPVAERLSRRRDTEVDALVVVSDRARRPRSAAWTCAWRPRTRTAAARGHAPAARQPAALLGLRHRTRPGPSRRDRSGGRGALPRARLLDAARDARPGHGPDKGLRARTRAARPAPGLVPGRAVPARRRRRPSAPARRNWPSTPSGASRPAGTTRWKTRLPSGWRPWRRPTSSSGLRTRCTAPSASATRPRCPGFPATASRCAACRSACRRRGTASPGGWAARASPGC